MDDPASSWRLSSLVGFAIFELVRWLEGWIFLLNGRDRCSDGRSCGADDGDLCLDESACSWQSFDGFATFELVCWFDARLLMLDERDC